MMMPDEPEIKDNPTEEKNIDTEALQTMVDDMSIQECGALRDMINIKLDQDQPENVDLDTMRQENADL